MNILILGAGGREHALAWKLSQSKKCGKIYVAPGNAGTGKDYVNVSISPTDFKSLGEFSIAHEVNIVVVGPEVPLVAGVSDYFKTNDQLKHISIIGPDKKGAMLEGSKDFSKEFMIRHHIPTASYRTFEHHTLMEGLEYLKKHPLPIVLKADGLAAGKGVIIAQTHEEAKETLIKMLSEKVFGEAGAKVVIEEYLNGIEVSVFVITDGISYKLLPEAKDYKRIGEGDTGLNTGGMGAISPVSFADEDFMMEVETSIIKPTISGLKEENIDYVGFIFFGLMNVNGKPYVIEYNARLGDPESEAIIPRIDNDLLEIFSAVAEKQLLKIKIEVKKETAATFMLVAGGYPEKYEKGKEITGLENILGAWAFHAATAQINEKVTTNGGRVVAVTALGKNLKEALEKARNAAESIQWEDKYFRKDIGQDLLLLQATHQVAANK